MLYAALFGHLHLQWNGEPIPLPTKSTAALFAYLLLERDRPQPREHLAMLLWPDTLEEKGRRNLRQTLLRLRKALPESWDDADVFRFDALMRDLEAALPVPRPCRGWQSTRRTWGVSIGWKRWRVVS